MVEVTLNDVILFFAVFYSSLDVLIEWDNYHSCSHPIQLWLLVSYLTIIVFRLSHYLGQWLSGEDRNDFLFLRGQRSPPKWVSVLTLGFLFPFFVSWTALGTVWLCQLQKYTPTCLPEGTQLWFFGFWLLLCYVWMGVYVSFIVIGIIYEVRSRRMEADLRLVESPDVVRRWGRLQFLANYGIHFVRRGLSPGQVMLLPAKTLEHPSSSPCSICLDELTIGDEVRFFDSCCHMFHRGCVDPWLLRNAVCPNCKQPIVRSPDASTAASENDSEANSICA